MYEAVVTLVGIAWLAAASAALLHRWTGWLSSGIGWAWRSAIIATMAINPITIILLTQDLLLRREHPVDTAVVVVSLAIVLAVAVWTQRLGVVFFASAAHSIGYMAFPDLLPLAFIPSILLVVARWSAWPRARPREEVHGTGQIEEGGQ